MFRNMTTIPTCVALVTLLPLGAFGQDSTSTSEPVPDVEPLAQCVPTSDFADPPAGGTSCGGVEWGMMFSVVQMTSYPGPCPNGPCSLQGNLRLGLVLREAGGKWRQTNPRKYPQDEALCVMWHGDKACRTNGGPTWTVGGNGTVPPTGHSDTQSSIVLRAKCGGDDSVTYTATSADGTCVVSRTLTMECSECPDC
jgi:hypothetical protein